MVIQDKSFSFFASRHIAAELLAASVMELFPSASFLEGGASDFGFFYDFVFEDVLDEKAFPLIEERMRFIAKERRPVKTKEMLRENAVEYFRYHAQPLKAEILGKSKESLIEIFHMLEFFDACPRPHVEHSGKTGFFKLWKIHTREEEFSSGKKQVVRIEGVVSEDKSSLKKLLKKSEEAKARDHRLLGEELKLFAIEEEAEANSCFWLPKGAFIRQTIIEWILKEYLKRGFKQVFTPSVAKSSSLKRAGVRDFFSWSRKSTNSSLDSHAFVSSHAPMHARMFKRKELSCNDSPVRYVECGDLYFPEASGHLTGLQKSINHCVDTASVFCEEESLLSEFISFLQFIEETAKIYCFNYKLFLNVEKSSSSPLWKKYNLFALEAIKSCGMEYECSKNVGDGPGIEVRMIDSMGREWRGAWFEANMALSKRLHLSLQDKEDKRSKLIMLTGSLFGSIERFLAFLLEHYEGFLPLWLAPEQARIIPVSDKTLKYAKLSYSKCQKSGLRVTIDSRNVKLGVKIRSAQCEKIPYAIVLGEEEEYQEKVAVRSWSQKDIQKVKLEEFLKNIFKDVSAKKIIKN